MEQYRDRYRDRIQDRTTNRTEKAGSQVRVPVAEEELQATKTLHEAGRLKLRKLVHTELRHFTVPVMTEEVRVSKERVTEERPVSGEVRKEEVRIEGEEGLKRKKSA